MAEECRNLAASIKDEAVRSQLLAVVEHFGRLAETHHLWDVLAAFRPAEHLC